MQWVQTMRKQTGSKTKTAGFNHDLSKVTIENKSVDNKDANLIKVPEKLAEQVILDGCMDYRPRLNDKKNVIKTR